MSRPTRGLSELLITEAIEAQLRQLDASLAVSRSALRSAEAADRLALHLGTVLSRALAAINDADRVEKGVALARRLIEQIAAAIPELDAVRDAPSQPGQVLRALLARLPDGTVETLPEPLIPLLDTTLLTNAPGEPRVGHQLLAEIRSSDRIEFVMAFIRRSGIGPLLGALREHCGHGRSLRVLTTTYTGSTEAEALEALEKLGAEIRVSYDISTTRLHAKAWHFHRATGFSTAYVGSSNLTHSAQVSGLEWNVRVSGARNPDVIAKMAAVFESYWNSAEFVRFDATEFRARLGTDGSSRQRLVLSPIEVRAEPFQERLLEQIALSRQRGYHRNLLVSATGTGKTVMAAIDYARLSAVLPRARLLFVAHREEILDQSLATFRHCLRDLAFGEMWVRGKRPIRFEHVFASIQSLSANGLLDLEPSHFDVVIIDEFHHAAAPSYRTLIDRVQPKELLGLTATPERSDGLPLLEWFDHRIAAELRLWDAVDQGRLSPFAYYGVHDGLDLREIPWRRGRGYDAEGLSKVLTGNESWARIVLRQVVAHVDDPHRMRALGFCVSVEHARFMARVFCEAGIPAIAVWGDTAELERRSALKDLAERRVNVLFSVDLFNEGVDLPAVDTILFLRPTDSATLFVQQLGRGLRRSEGKTVCTVIDFVGRHRTEFRFDRRFRALLAGSRKQLQEQVRSGFPFLPAGCHMELDAVATQIVLDNLRQAVPSQWNVRVEALQELALRGSGASLGRYLDETNVELSELYAGGKSWSDLCADAGLALHPPGPQEAAFRRACGRLLHVDDLVRIKSYRRFLALDLPPDPASLSLRDQKLLRMLVGVLLSKAIDKTASLHAGVELLWEHPQVRSEVIELLGVLEDRIDHLQIGLARHLELPLQVHARYSRIEILAAFGVGSGARVPPWQSGVLWAKDARADLLAFTLDKTSGHFSPTTRYRDYAISRDLIHWESQSTTRAESETGQRYRHHGELGTHVMLFARLRSDDRAFWFLGPATYVRHESELPMAVTWRLQIPLSGDLFASFAAAIA